MISEHFAALQSRIEAGADMTGRVFDTVRTVDGGGLVRDQYVILYRSAPAFDLERLAAVAQFNNSRLTFDVGVRMVGTSSAQVIKLIERVQAQLVGHSLIVSGRVCAPIEIYPDDVGRVVPDDSVFPHMHYCDMSFDLVSEPA